MALSVNANTIKKLIMDLAKKENLYIQEKNPVKGAAIGILATGIGICLGGIPGILAGAALGGVSLACVKGVVKPLSDYLEKLSPEMQEKLYNGVVNLLKAVIWAGLDFLLERVLGDTKLKNNIVSYIKSFFEGSLKIKVVQKNSLSY